MEMLITVPQAVDLLGLDETILNRLIQEGKIAGGITIEGVKMVSILDVVSQLPVLKRPESEKYMGLSNNPISISAAARKYGVPQQTISRWAAKGYIKVLGYDGRKTLIDESQIAIYSEIYHSTGGKQGRWVFKGGYLYNKKR